MFSKQLHLPGVPKAGASGGVGVGAGRHLQNCVLGKAGDHSTSLHVLCTDLGQMSSK